MKHDFSDSKQNQTHTSSSLELLFQTEPLLLTTLFQEKGDLCAN